MSPSALVVVHAAATWFMTGLSWTVAAVHYPLFAAVGGASFPAYERRHMRAMTRLIAVPWATEGVTAAWLLAAPPEGVGVVLPAVGAALVLLVVVVTAVAAVPAHEALSTGFDEATHRRLLRADRVRVAAWTARALLAAVMVART